MENSELTPFITLLEDTSVTHKRLKESMLQILIRQKQEIDGMDMMGNPILYINSMDVFNVNLAFTQQFVDWMELHKLGFV